MILAIITTTFKTLFTGEVNTQNQIISKELQGNLAKLSQIGFKPQIVSWLLFLADTERI